MAYEIHWSLSFVALVLVPVVLGLALRFRRRRAFSSLQLFQPFARMVALSVGDRAAILAIELHSLSASGDRLLIVPAAGPSPQRRVALVGGETARWVGEDVQPGADRERPDRRAESAWPSRLKPCGRGLEPEFGESRLGDGGGITSCNTRYDRRFGRLRLGREPLVQRRGAVLVTAQPRSLGRLR